MLRFIQFLGAFALVLVANIALGQSKIDPILGEQNAPGKKLECLIYFKPKADLQAAYSIKDWRKKGQFVVDQLQTVSNQSQGNVLQILNSKVEALQSFWIVNMVWSVCDYNTIQQISELAEVAYITNNPSLQFSGPQAIDLQSLQSRTAEWGVQTINADDVWALGYHGEGVVVGGQDTGYDWDHIALKLKYRGWNAGAGTVNHNYNWHDAIHVAVPGSPAGNSCGFDSPEPCDDGYHGTHTMGTMVGSEGTNDVGVAPAAKWIGCRNMDEGWGQPSTYYECFQWFLAPTDLSNGSPNPGLRPMVINNSWTCPPVEGCNSPSSIDSLYNAIVACRASGIVVVASAGNSGSDCGSVSEPPPFLASSFTIGATDINDVIAGFSSRGPGIYNGTRVKPDVSAPGVNVRSTIPGDAYGNLSGTSMAGPHVVGAVALILSTRPALQYNPDTIESILRYTALPLTSGQTCGGVPGSEIPNNTYGNGRINVLAAVEAALASPLEVVIRYFEASTDQKVVLLKWATETEFNASHFVIQRSTDTKNWEDIGSVAALGNSTSLHHYQFTDNNAIKGISYYRLKQMDLDLLADYSQVRAIQIGKKTLITLSPNPAKTEF
ncbi:MAG: S8 family serine peptidase, partial [Saprospiraceae bacterium]